MDKYLRQLERQASRSGDADDMYAYFGAYRRVNPKQFSSSSEIPIEKTCYPVFEFNFHGYAANLEFFSYRKRARLKLECKSGQCLFQLLNALLGTAIVEADHGDDINYSEEGSGSDWSRNSVILYLTWLDAGSYVVPTLLLDRRLYSENCPKDILGLVMANGREGLPRGIIAERDEPALQLSVLPQAQTCLNENFEELMEWEKLLAEGGLLNGAERVASIEKRIIEYQNSLRESKIALGKDVARHIEINSGVL